MKKTMFCALALLIFTACGTQESQKEQKDEDLSTPILHTDEDVEVLEVEEEQSSEPLQQDEKKEVKTIVKKQISYQTPSVIEKIDATCSSLINNVEKDNCYFEQIKDEMIYYKEDINIPDDVRICDRISGTAWQHADCYQMFAVKNLNIDFCDYGSEPLTTRPENSGYGTAEDCRKNLKYEYEDTKWVATGASPTITTWPYEYEGTANLKGWMVDMVSYGSEDFGPKTPHFHVAEESRPKLPPPFQKKYENYNIGHNPQEVLEKLKTSSAQNPATITVSRIKAPWEGTPVMDITKVH